MEKCIYSKQICKIRSIFTSIFILDLYMIFFKDFKCFSLMLVWIYCLQIFELTYTAGVNLIYVRKLNRGPPKLGLGHSNKVKASGRSLCPKFSFTNSVKHHWFKKKTMCKCKLFIFAFKSIVRDLQPISKGYQFSFGSVLIWY